jgi:15-cis-phytoene synthase
MMAWMKDIELGHRIGLLALAVFTFVAIVGYGTFGLNPQWLANFPDLASFYAISFTFFAQGHVLLCGAILFAYLIHKAGFQWLAAFAAVYALSLGSELAGTGTGLPFGHYEYTPLLGAMWFDAVPWLIPLSWFAMAVPSFAIAAIAFDRSRPIARVASATFLLVMWDLALDPAMSYLTPYWVWEQPGAFYGMPMINLFGWTITGLVIMWIMHAMRADAWLNNMSPAWMTTYYALTLLMPLGMIVVAGLWIAVAVTLLAVGVAIGIFLRATRIDRMPGRNGARDHASSPEPREREATAVYFKRHSRSFSFASRAFSADQRKLVSNLYAFCRTVDDIVDAEDRADAQTIDLQLNEWLARARASYDGETTHITWLDDLMRASRESDLPFSTIEELVAGVRSDNGPVRIQTWEELDLYTYRVASIVGIWMCYLFGVRDLALLHRAEAMGRAMQMTNIVRDVGEDLRQDRIYLPKELLDAHDVSEADLLAMARDGVVTANYRDALCVFLGRTDAYYTVGWTGVGHLPDQFGRATAVAADIYRGIHAALRANAYDNLTRRAYTSTAEKLLLSTRAIWKLRLARLQPAVLRPPASVLDIRKAVARNTSAATATHLHQNRAVVQTASEPMRLPSVLLRKHSPTVHPRPAG